jgi:FtsP/CotA-like multicopper oxidase with cupredoxin domain
MRMRSLTALVAALALAALDPQLSGAQAASAGEPVRFSIAIANRKVDPAQQRIRARQGDTVELAFTSDETTELHLHGYDRQLNVGPAAPAVLVVEAKIAGRFSIEAHGFGGDSRAGRASARRHVVLLYLEIYPR